MIIATLLSLTVVGGVNLAEPLTPKQQADAIAWVAAMKTSSRGPYRGVAWFCHDGTVLPPKAYACVDHGGGLQYGVLSNEAKKLEELGVHVGTILAGTPSSAFSQNDFYRARAYVVEAYLERALGGWVLQSSQNYRGFRQMENEEDAARTHLIDLATKKEMLQENRNILVRLMRSMPYGRQGSLADEVRALAGLIGDADRDFANLRFKIHAMPEPTDVDAVAAYCEKKDGELLALGRELLDKMRTLYHPTSRVNRLKDVRQWIGFAECKAAIDTFVATPPEAPLELLRHGYELMRVADGLVRHSPSPKVAERNLLLIHSLAFVESLWVGLTAPLAKMALTRAEALEITEKLVQAAGFLGTLSPREVAVAQQNIDAMRSGESQRYADGADRLNRVLEWARARHLADFGLPLQRYAGVERKAQGVIDDILRSGVMLPLAAVLDRINADIEKLRGGGHKLVGLGSDGAAAVRGENSGVATGPLRILEPGEEPRVLRREEIVLLREIPPELPPVAGIITVGSAGSLSHVALLARNLGIPHAAIGGNTADELAKINRQEVILGVSADRRVVLGPKAAFAESDRKVLVQAKPLADQPFLEINATILDISTTRISPLSEVSPDDSGRRLGPKAAELGRLRTLFPNRVSDAAVIPFGAFVRHVDRPGADGSPSPMAKLRAVYAQTKGRPPAEVEPQLLEALADFRQAIATLPFAEGFEAEVKGALERMGRVGTFGVFVRSDTNVEDLKEFTGAGLNLTVPNRARFESIMAAIREVWASPYTERSFRWRQRILKNPEHVYPSVILHKTIPADTSGVMVTTDLEGTAKNALTVSASEGVAAVVDGGAPETVVVEGEGSVRLLSSSRTATRKIIPRPPGEGVTVVPAKGRDPLLGEAEIAELQRLAQEVKSKIPSEEGLPWDIEFGFYDNQAWLMQIRPLRTAKRAATHPYLVQLDRASQLPQMRLNLLEKIPGSI